MDSAMVGKHGVLLLKKLTLGIAYGWACCSQLLARKLRIGISQELDYT